MATNNKKKQYTGTDYLHEVIQAVRDAKSAGVSGAQNLSQYVNDNTSERGQTYADGAKRDYTDESRRNAQRARDTAAKTAKFQKAANAITSQYTAAWNEMNSKLQKASTSTGITAAGDIGAAATAVQKKATGQLGSSAMTGKSSLKAAVEDQSSKSKIPWTQPVTAQNVKVKTSKDKANEDNAKWASRAMRDAETAMDRAIADKDSAAYQKAVAQYEKASEAYAESTAKVIQNENAMQAQADYVRLHASEDQGKALAAQRDYASNMTDYFADVETDKDRNKLTAEQKSKYNQISEQYRKKYETLNNLSQANDYYADSTSRITSMDDATFQNLYTSYQEAKEQAEEYAQQAQRARKQADQYLRTNTGMYNMLTALAEQYQQKADAAQAQADEITGGDSKVAYAIENRGETTTLSSSARKDRDFEKYVELGEKSDWVPELREGMSQYLSDSATKALKFANRLGTVEIADSRIGVVANYLDTMSDADRSTLYYYIGKGDFDTAQKFFEYIEPSIEQKISVENSNASREISDQHPIIGTAANALFQTTVAPAMGLVVTAENAANSMSGSRKPSISGGGGYLFSDINRGVQSGVSQNLQRNFGISETSANFLSGTIISMANNAAQFGLVGGGLQLNLAGVRNAFANLSGSEAARVAAQEALDQAANSINTWLPLAIMSTGAGIDTIREQLESGSDFGKALLYGGLCGAVEAWTEKIGVDSWVELASKGVKSGLLKGAWSAAGNIDRIKLQNIVKTVIGVSNQALSEGGEEVISNVVDTILDVAINGEDSEFMQYRNNLIAQGYSAAEAERKATIQFYVKNSGESFAGGALSGAVFGVFSIPANLQSNQRIGQAIIDSGTELDLVNDGLSYNTDTEVYQIASAIAKKLDTRNGYQPSAREITQLSVAMSEESQHSPSASITAQQLQDGGSNQLSTFATELQATGAVSGREAIQANTVLMKAMDGEALTGSDIKALHAEIPAVREILSQKLGTTITTGSAEEVRNAVSRYVRDGNSAKTQAEAQKNARSIIQDAKPYARQAELAETQSEVAALRESAETEAQARIDAEDAQLDTAAADRAADTTARIAEAADQQVTESKMQASRDTRGNLNYKEFSDQYRAAHPEAGNSEITAAYDKANQAYRNKDTIEIDGHEFTRSEVKELLRVRGVKATDAMVNQMFIDSIMQEQEGGEKPHYSLNDVENIVQGKPQSMQSEAQNEQKAPQKTEAESQPKDSHTKNQDGTAETKAESKSSDTERAESKRHYTLNEDFASELDAWDGTSQKTFTVGTTSEALKSIGVEDRNIIWRGDKISKIMKKHSNMTLEVIEQVPNILENPIIVLKSQTVPTRISMFGEVYDSSGVPVTAILDLEPTSNGGQLMDMYIVSSAYGKDTDLKGFIERSEILYLDENKKRADQWMQRLGLQLPLHASKGGSLGSVTYTDGKVKIEGTPWADLVSAQQNDTGNDTANDTTNDTEEAAENSPAPSGKYDKAHPNKVAEWVSKEAEKALHDMGIENAQVTVDYEMDKASNGYYVLKDGKRQIVLNGQLGGTTRKGQVYSAQQNLQFIVAHELGHIVQGVGYTGETNLYTDQILNLYQEDTGTTDAELEAGIQQVMDRYLAAAKRKDSGISLNSSDITWEYARGEYAADRLAEMLGEYNTLRKLARKQNRNLIQKALDMVGGFRGALKTKRGSKAKAGKTNGLTWVGIAEIYDEAAGNLEKVLKESMKNAGKMKITMEQEAKRASVDMDIGTDTNYDSGNEGMPTIADIDVLHKIGRKDVANLSSEELKLAEPWAHKFYKELGVKSPFFSSWFGTWRGGDTAQVSVLALDRSEKTPAGKAENADTGRMISWGRQLASETMSKSRSSSAHIAVELVGNIDQIVQNAVYLDSSISVPSSKNKMPNTAFMHHMYTVANYNGNSYLLKLYVEEAMDKKGREVFSRAYTLKNVQAVQIDAEKTGATQSSVLSNEGGLTAGKAPARISVAELVDLVKAHDKEFTYNSSSKVVNEDGTPKVMYHGTSNGGFNVFDPYSSNFGLFGTGSYFTDNQDVAKSYTQKGKGENPQVYAAYLNIRNPLDMDAKANVEQWREAVPDAVDYFTDCKTNEDCFRALKEYCQDEMMYNYDAYDYIQSVIVDMGYDGITHIGGGRFNRKDGTRHRVYIVFDSEQVKSATDNIGTFDRDNPDIRYSLNDDETDLPELGENSPSKFSRFTDTYEKGTALVGKSQSVKIASELKKEYSSSVDTQELAARYRQMTSIGKQLGDLTLSFVMNDGVSSSDVGSQYSAVREELLELGREIADDIIDYASSKEQGDTTVYDYLRDRLTGEEVYVPDKIKQDIATALQCDTWNEARRQYYYVLSRTVNDASKGIEISSLYDSIREQFPGAVEGGILTRSDQLKAIIDAYDSARDSREITYNPLARNIAERAENRERIAEDIVSRIEHQANDYAKQQFDEYSAAKKAEAARLERQAAYQEKQAKAQQSEGRSGEAAQKQADALREQAAEARLMGQTDEETILEAVHDEGLGGEKAEQKLETTILSPEVIEWAKHSKELDKVVARMLQKKAKREQRQKMSQVRSNTFENSEFFTEAELALDGMKKENFTYQVKSEAESFGEAAKRLMGETFDRSEIEHQKQDMHEAAGRLDSNYLHWYDTLPTKENWTGTDLDTAMMILNQIRTNDRETGDYRESSKWAKLIQERGTAGGQFIQAFAKWSRTPDGIIAKAVKHLDDTHLGKDINGKAIQRLNEENQQTFQQIGIEEQKNRVLREEYEQLRKEQQTVREMLRDANAKNREADRSNDALYDKIDKELDKIVKLSQEIQTKEFENAKIQDVLDVLDSKVRTLTAKLSQLGTENTHVVTERDRLTAQLGYLEQQRSQLEQQIAAGRKEIAFLNAAIDALREKNGVSEISLGEITKELQDILDGLKSDVSDKAAQKGVLRKIVQGLMRTHSAEDIRNLVTKTSNQSLNDRWGRLMGDLLDNVSDPKKERIINDMTRIADMINAAESWQIAVNMGDKNAELKMRNQLIDCIMNACKTRGMKPSRKVEEMMRATFAGQTTEYLNQFARVSLANIADDYQGSSWGQKFSTWQYLAQLLNLRTSLRNVTSNTVFNGIDTGARNLAVPIDKFVSLFTKKRTVGTSLRHGSDKSALRGATEQAGRAMLEVMLDVDMNNARSKYGEGARRTFKMCQQGIAGAVARNLSKLEMVNGISLNVTDEFFKGAIYQGTINSTAKLVEKGWMTEAEAVEFATQDMLYRTFQDDTLVGTLLNKLHDWGNYVGVGNKRAEANGTYQKGKKVQFYTHDFGLGDLVIKYRGVPGALITRTVEFSPAGYLKALRSCINLIQSGGTDTHAQRNFVLGVSRATTGSGLIALFWLLAAKGLLKRDDDEEDKNVAAMNRAEGQSGTQLNLSALDRLINGGSTDWESGDKLIDIGFLDPLSSDMTMGTLIYKAMQEDGETIPSAWSVAQGGMMSAAFSDLSMMDTINDAIYAAVYHDENSNLSAGWDFVITTSASALSGFLPSLMRQAAQASDNYYRDAYGGGWIEDNVSGGLGAALQQGANQLAMGIPGLRQTLPKKLDPMGNEKVYSPDGSTARNVANALVNPGKYSIYSQTSVSEELGRVRRLTGDASFYPDRNGPNTIIYGDEKVKLTDAQKRQYLQNAGNLFEELAAETMKTDAYKNATNERKAELLSEVKSYTTYKAKQEFYERLHSTDAGYTPWETDTWRKTEAGMEIGVSFGEMRQILSDTSEANMPSDYDKNGDTISGTRDGKILDYLNDLSYSDKQKLQLYSVLKGSGSESSIQKMQNIMNAGLSFYEASKVKQEHTSIDDQDHSINNTDMNDHDYFTKWLNDEGFSESEIEAINENYPFYNRMRQQTDSILKRLTESGMDYDAAYEVASKVAAIEPEDGEDEVSSAQKYNVILEDYSMSTREKQAAISAIAGEYSLFGQLDEGAAQSMMELYESSGQTSALSANAGTNYSVDGIQYDYTEDQQEAYNQAYIQIMNGISGSTISSAKVMDDIKDIAANAGKYSALQQSGENPDLDSSTYGLYRKAQQAMDTGLDVARYCEIKSTCNSFTADKDSSGESVSGSKKKKVVAYLKAQGLTSQQYSFFYSTIMGYK